MEVARRLGFLVGARPGSGHPSLGVRDPDGVGARTGYCAGRGKAFGGLLAMPRAITTSSSGGRCRRTRLGHGGGVLT
jgi:hypothetical protein